MKRSNAARLLSLLLAVVMLFSLFSVMVLAEEQEPEEQTVAAETAEPSADDPDPTEEPEPTQEPAVTTYSDFLTDMDALESYADAYAREHAGEDPVALVINFIRTGIPKYTESTWTTFCGPEDTAFTSYVTEQDASNGTHAVDLRALGSFTLPNGNEVEFGHMFGCMDMSYHTGNRDTADLGSWAGDICDLVQLSTNAGVTGTVDEMVAQISSTPTLFLYDDPVNHSFGQMDLYADLDAFYILSRLNGSNTIGQIMRSYYTAQLNDSFRAAYFLENRLGGLKTRSDIRATVLEIYSANAGIGALEVKYVESGVDPDLRKACCYVFADYLYDTAKDRLENAYYEVFSSESTMLAPGVTQELKLARTADDKQLAYYIATADITRDDVQVYANYANNTGEKWQMSRVSDQVAAAQAKHTDPDDPAHYIENYNAVVGVNADFYNMQTGKVSGVLVMEGTVWNNTPNNNGNYFFAILNDGTPVIARNSEWSQYRDNVKEAVGGGALLVKDGKVNITSTTDYYNDRASRTAAGITYDGRVVLMVLDGRQMPWSCGGSAVEIAQIMLDAGCVIALNLDGGGSTTYVAKQEGSDTAKVVSRPSDGFERSVSSSLLVVSTAKPSNVFDHAVVTADYDYLTPGTALAVNALGVTATGGAIDLPEGAYLRVSDESVGTLSDQLFTAAAVGDTQVQVVSADGAVLGAKTLHVVDPTDLKFTSDSLNVVYGEPKTLPLEASYNNNVVKLNPNDVQFFFLRNSLVEIAEFDGSKINLTQTELVLPSDYPEAGAMDGFDFTGNGDAEPPLRTLTIGAVLTSQMAALQEVMMDAYFEAFYAEYNASGNQQKAQLLGNEAMMGAVLDNAAQIKLYLYDADEANFDFNDATGGDGLLNYKREVSNSAYRDDENTYYVIDAQQDMVTSYTFAVDMTKIPIPSKLSGLLYMLPGGTQEGRSAWSFLLQLAERISPLTTVTVTIELPEGFDADIENMKLVNEYFTMTSKTLEGRTLTITANFKEQSQPINPATANPLCVLSGLKLTPTDAAAWNENQQLDVHLEGTLVYDIYAHFHILENMSKDPDFSAEYGLKPYSNRDYDSQDYGGHFSTEDEPVAFSDDFRLNGAVKDGWMRENGSWVCYDDGTLLTGVQYLPSYDAEETDFYWYDLGDDGASRGKYTGFAQRDGKWYYPVNGVPAVGWYEIDGDQYYFTSDGSAQTGTKTFAPATYDFDDHGKVLHGCWVTTAAGTRYYYAGQKYYQPGGGGATVWIQEIEGKLYGFGRGGYRCEGGYYLLKTSNGANTLYLFDDAGVCLDIPADLEGVVTLKDGDKVLRLNGRLVDSIDYGEFFDADGNRLDNIYGAVTAAYYYFGGSYRAARNTNRKVVNSNGYLTKGETYYFDDNSQYLVDLSNVKNGIYEEDEGKYFYKDNARSGVGLFRYSDGYLYYAAGTQGKLRCGTSYPANYPNTTKTGMPAQVYYFDPDGRLFAPEITFRAVVDATGQVLEEDCGGLQISYGIVLNDPVAPSYLGYELTGWRIESSSGKTTTVKMIDGVVKVTDLNNAINNALNKSGYDRDTAITVTALYERVVETYTVSLSYALPDGSVIPNYTTDPYLVGSPVKLTAPETYTSGGMTYSFDHWVVSGENYGARSVTLRPSVSAEYDAQAVYAVESARETPELRVIDAFREKINDIDKLGVTTSWYVPEGCTVEAVGFRLSLTDDTLQSDFKASASKLKTDTGAYTLHIKVTGKEDTPMYICAYLIVKDNATGETQTILTPVKTYIWSQL